MWADVTLPGLTAWPFDPAMRFGLGLKFLPQRSTSFPGASGFVLTSAVRSSRSPQTLRS